MRTFILVIALLALGCGESKQERVNRLQKRVDAAIERGTTEPRDSIAFVQLMKEYNAALSELE